MSKNTNTLDKEFDSYFTQDYHQSSHDNLGGDIDLDEVTEIEIEQFHNPYQLVKGTTIEVLEDQYKRTFMTGIPLEKIRYSDIKDIQYSGIDGSVASIKRTSVSMIICRTAVGYDGKGFPEGNILPEFRQYIISDSNVLKPGITLTTDFTSTVRGLNRNAGYNRSVEAATGNFLAYIECKSAIEYFNQDNAGDYIIYDGGLYRRTPLLDLYIDRVQQNSNFAVPIAMNKRVTDRSWWLYVQKYRDELQSMHFDTDVAFLLNVLNPGERTPIFRMIRQGEKKVPKNLRRIASFIRLNSGKITRIETTYENFYQFETILAQIYYLSAQAAGELPLALSNAHELSKISQGQKDLISNHFDTNLQRAGIPAIDPNAWSF